jgi:hypothetical protein
MEFAIAAHSDWTSLPTRALVSSSATVASRQSGARAMARKDAIRAQESSNQLRHDRPNDAAALGVLIRAMSWRLRESAACIGEAEDAIAHREIDRDGAIVNVEPLLFDARRILSEAFVIAQEAKENNRAADLD